MAVSEEKMRIVINNYFKSECNVDTSIREAFEKGFRIGVKKGQLTSPGKETERKVGKWINYIEDGFVECPFCKSATNCDGDIAELHYCFNCGAKLEGDDD